MPLPPPSPVASSSPLPFLASLSLRFLYPSLARYADRKGLPLEGVDVRLSHSKVHASECKECISGKEGKQPARFDRVERIITLRGHHLTEAQRRRLLEIADMCPVHRSLEGGSVAVISRLAEEGETACERKGESHPELQLEFTSRFTPRLSTSPSASLLPCFSPCRTALLASPTPEVDPTPSPLSPRLATLRPGFEVRRVLPFRQKMSVGPFVFMDHMGPASSALEVGPHPHIGLCALTYLYGGALLHRDSTGAEQPILPGDVSFMVSGKGSTHSERSAEVEHLARQQKGGGQLLHGLQLWVALPVGQEASSSYSPALP